MSLQSDIQKITPTLEKFSPLLLDAVTGSWGSLIQGALKIAFGAIDADDLNNKIQNDPASKLKIQQVEEHYKSISQKINERDNENARKFDVDLINGSKYGWLIPFITVIYTMSFVIYVFMTTLNYLPKDASTMGLLSMMATTILHHFMGTFKKEK